MIDGDWVDDPSRVKDEFRNHFAARFQDPGICHGKINFSFPNRLNHEQSTELESSITREEIRNAVWGCGENKSPGPDGFTFEFFRKFWSVVGPDFCIAVEWFFYHASFSIGCDSSFIALIPKSLDPESVGDYRPISLIGRMASILVNGSPTSEFQFHRGLKQGDPLAPYLFILVMESLHLSFTRVIEAGIFTGVRIDPSTMISHLFYANDVVFIGEWSQDNLKGIMHSLRCFSLLSGLSINIKKSYLLGVGIPASYVNEAASSIGCSVMKAPFKYLGVMVGGNASLVKAWDDTINKLRMRLSKWKLKTLFIGNRCLASPLYIICHYIRFLRQFLTQWKLFDGTFLMVLKMMRGRLHGLNRLRCLRLKKQGGLGVSSFYALNRALLVKWVWRLLYRDNSLWARIIHAIHGLNGQELFASHSSTWSSIVKEINILKTQGIDIISHCKIRVGNGRSTSFWNDLWIGDSCFRYKFPRLYALDINKECTVADKMVASFTSSFRREVRGGAESLQLTQILDLLGTVILSNMEDRWIWDLNGDGEFCVKDVRNLLDATFLPKADSPTRWIKTIPIKVNIFAWKDLAHLLLRCDLAIEVTRLVYRWWNWVWVPLDSYISWLSWIKALRMNSRSKSVLAGVFLGIGVLPGLIPLIVFGRLNVPFAGAL
ncbi:RNA-directed DNA polymerase, eukaryota [Tanacetum coccineum]